MEYGVEFWAPLYKKNIAELVQYQDRFSNFELFSFEKHGLRLI